MRLPVLNKDDRTVIFGTKKDYLTPKEYGILETLLSEPGRTFSPEEIYRSAWKEEPFDCRLIISVHIRHIREKIESDPSRPACIKSLWGRGYRAVPVI